MGQSAGPGGRSSRCIALVGPYLSGKTTLLEALLARTGGVTRQGKVADRNTAGDASQEARDQFSARTGAGGFLPILAQREERGPAEARPDQHGRGERFGLPGPRGLHGKCGRFFSHVASIKSERTSWPVGRDGRNAL